MDEPQTRAKLSITTAWNEASAFVRREGHLLFPIAFLLGTLPWVALQLLGPEQPAPGQTPEAGPWLLLLPVALALGMVANLAICYLALRAGRSVGESLRRGLRRLLPLLGAALIIGVLGMILFFIASAIALAAVPGAAEAITRGGTPGPEVNTATGLIMLLLAPLFFFVVARLSLMAPVAAAEDIGPLAIVRRSWRLTSGNFWRLLGFMILIGIAFLIVAMAVQFVLGSIVLLLEGRPEPGSIGTLILVLVTAALQAVFTMFVVATLSRIYVQRAGDGPNR